jgi:hypothetical protein
MRIYNTELFYPMLAMFLWTVAVMLRNMQVRVVAVKRGELTNKYFELLQGAEPPEAIRRESFLQSDRDAAALLYHLSCRHVHGPRRCNFIVLAWSYVVLRIGHSLIHLMVNKVAPRFFFCRK